MMASPSRPAAFSLQLVGDDVVHQGGLAHAGAGHVEVVTAQQVLGEANLPGLPAGGVAHQGALGGAADRGQQGPGAGAFHQRSLVPLAGRVPQGRRLSHPQDAALAEQTRSGGVQTVRGNQWLYVANLELGPGGMIEVAVGGGHPFQQFLGPLETAPFRQDGHHLQLGFEGDAGDLLPYQDGVVDPAAGLLPAPPAPACHGQAQDGTRAQERCLQVLAVLHPQVALQGGQRPRAQHGHGDAVQLQGLGLVGVGGIGPLLARVLEGLLLVSLGPVGTEGAQQQAGDQPLAGPQVAERPQEGDEGVGAGVQQVVVPESAQGHELRPAGAEGQAPGLLPRVQPQRVVPGRYLADAGLGVVGGQLSLDHLPVQAAGHQGDAVGVTGQFQGEGFGDGDGLEQVLHAQQGPLAGARRRHRQQRRGPPVPGVAEDNFLHVDIHTGCLCLRDLFAD